MSTHIDKIVIGTPIRDTKEYGIYDWLKSVQAINWLNLQVIMVDNSDDGEFADRIRKYSDAIALKHFSVFHIIGCKGAEPEQRLVKSREKIREEFLKTNGEYWFSWECDILLPPEALMILYEYSLRKIDVVNHCYPNRTDKTEEVGGMGCSLYRRRVLEQFSFLDGGGYAHCDKDRLNCFYSGDSWLATRLIRTGHKIIDLHNIIPGIQHLGQ